MKSTCSTVNPESRCDAHRTHNEKDFQGSEALHISTVPPGQFLAILQRP